MRIRIISIIAAICVLFVVSVAAAIDIKQSTSRNVSVFMVDTADHITGLTGLTLTIYASKNGGAMSQISPSQTELDYGWYSLALTDTHTDTIGDLVLHVTGTSADPSDLRLNVVANVEADSYGIVNNVTYGNSAIKTAVVAIPTNPLLDDDVRLPATIIASQADLSTHDTDIKAAIEGIPAGATPAEIWGYADRSLTTSPITLPVMQGSVYTATATPFREVPIVRGDSPTVTFELFDSDGNPANYTGWTPKFGAKASPSDTAYVIAVKDAVWVDASKGQGYVALTSTDTATVKKLYAEIELRNGDQRLTAIKFVLKIMEDVIR